MNCTTEGHLFARTCFHGRCVAGKCDCDEGVVNDALFQTDKQCAIHETGLKIELGILLTLNVLAILNTLFRMFLAEKRRSSKTFLYTAALQGLVGNILHTGFHVAVYIKPHGQKNMVWLVSAAGFFMFQGVNILMYLTWPLGKAKGTPVEEVRVRTLKRFMLFCLVAHSLFFSLIFIHADRNPVLLDQSVALFFVIFLVESMFVLKKLRIVSKKMLVQLESLLVSVAGSDGEGVAAASPIAVRTQKFREALTSLVKLYKVIFTVLVLCCPLPAIKFFFLPQIPYLTYLYFIPALSVPYLGFAVPKLILVNDHAHKYFLQKLALAASPISLRLSSNRPGKSVVPSSPPVIKDTVLELQREEEHEQRLSEHSTH